MASYTFKTWETINLRTVTNNTYYRVLDHSSEHPKDEVTGVIYDGLILAGYGIQNLNEILSQYMDLNQITFTSSLEINEGYIKNFYVYYSDDNWQTFFMDDITLVYNWGYDTFNRVRLSDPVINILDVRQWFLYSLYNNSGDIGTITVTIGDKYQYSALLLPKTSYNFVKYLNDSDIWYGEFNFDYSYDYFITRNTLDPGSYQVLTINSKQYIIINSCYKYCLYYLNKWGGWDSLLFMGKTIQNDNLTRLSYKNNYRARRLDFNKINYLTTIQEGWNLTTSFMSDSSSEKMDNLLASNCMYLHNLEDNIITPVVITNSQCEHKSYKNQGRKLYTYTINVSSSQPKYRI